MAPPAPAAAAGARRRARPEWREDLRRGGGGLRPLELLSSESGDEARGAFMTSSPSGLITLTALRPDLGCWRGRELPSRREAPAPTSRSALADF